MGRSCHQFNQRQFNQRQFNQKMVSG
jgi:hypothetical protein